MPGIKFNSKTKKIESNETASPFNRFKESSTRIIEASTIIITRDCSKAKPRAWGNR
jgi:hypothetical protein